MQRKAHLGSLKRGQFKFRAAQFCGQKECEVSIRLKQPTQRKSIVSPWAVHWS
jgi:hypothetical protein